MFHEGSFKIAEKSGCPIIPMSIYNSAAIFEDHLPKIKKAHVILEYCPPIYMKDLSREEKKFIGIHVQDIIKETYFKNKSEVIACLYGYGKEGEFSEEDLSITEIRQLPFVLEKMK